MTTSFQPPLSGYRLLVTRPEGQGDGLASLLHEAGAEVIMAPLLAIEAPEAGAPGHELLNQLGAWDWLIFVSANAVRWALTQSAWTSYLAQGTRIAAIGDATRDALESNGIRVDLVPSTFSSEGLLEEPGLQAVQGQRILIVRGHGGRELLRDSLASRGAEVAVAELYRRVPVPLETLEYQLQSMGAGSFDAIIVTSGEALGHLTALWQRPIFLDVPRPLLLVPGPRLVALAHEWGWRLVLEADSAGDESLAQALRQYAHAQRTGQTAFHLREAVIPGSPEQPSTEPSAGSAHEPATQPETEAPLPNLEPERPGPEPDPIEEMPVSEPEIETAAATPEDAPAMESPVREPAPEAKAGKGKKDKKAEREPKPPRSGGFAWMGYVLLFGTLVLVGGGWFVLQELRSRQEGLGGQISDKTQQVQEVTHQLTATQTEIASLHAQIASLQSQAATDDAKIERLLAEHGEQLDVKLDATRSDLAQAIQQIQSQLNKTRGDLLVTDAEYLLGVANQKLNLIGDVKSVLAAMEAADQRLHESGDPAVFKVREVLAGEMASLRKVEGLDVVGISADLIALEKKVNLLPTHLPHAGTIKQHEAQKADEKAHAGPQDPDADAVDHAIQGIKELVTVRRIDRGVDALLTPEQVHTLQQILILKFETTRAALLRNDERLYRDSLNDATGWIEEHFDVNQDATRDTLKDIVKLREQSLNVAYPDISKSLVMLQNIEKLRLEAEDQILKKKDSAAAPRAEPPKAAPTPVPAAAPETPPAPAVPTKPSKNAKDKEPPAKLKPDAPKSGEAPKTPESSATPEVKPKEAPKPETPASEPAPAAPSAQPAEASGERL
jgi:uroporphyrinogen-III synthase/uncharacterized protein HemX